MLVSISGEFHTLSENSMAGVTGALVHCVVRILATIVIAALVYLCFKGARKIFKVSWRR